MSLGDIDDFVQKSTILQQTIRGIADGTIDDTIIDLGEFGILTPEQQKAEDERNVRARKELERKRAMEEKEKREREKAQWWEGAICLYGPIEGEREIAGGATDVHDVDNERQEYIDHCQEKMIRDRYSSDYSRWADNAYKPDDEATKEEEKCHKQLVEKLRNDEFEKRNKDWCEQIKGDIQKRDNEIEKKEERAVSLRKEGNKYFKKKKYLDALEKYSVALQITPYAVSILTNMALVHEKLNYWEDVVEYCSRAIYIDKTCAKALFLRHKALVELHDEERALADLKICLDLNPENELFYESELKLSLKLKNDSIESEIERCVTYIDASKIESISINNPSVSEKGFQGLTLEKIFFTVVSKEDDPNRSLMINQQCQYVNTFMDIITRCGVDFKACEAFQIFANKPELTLWEVFVSYKLCKCPIASAYMRKSGHLKQLLSKVRRFCQYYDDDNDDGVSKEKSVVIQILGTVSELLKTDKATRILCTDCLDLEDLFQLYAVKIQNLKDVDLVASLGSFLLVFNNNKLNSCNDLSLFIPNSEKIWQHLCSRINWCSHQQFPIKSKWYVCDIICSCANFIAIALTSPQVKRTILRQEDCDKGRENPVKDLLSSVRFSKDISKKDTTKSKEMKEAIVKALLTLSTIRETRNYFSSRGHTKQSKYHLTLVLLALSNSPKSEYEQTREMALMTLTNLLTTIDGKDEGNCISVGQDIVSYGGIEILVSLFTSEISSSPTMKHRSSGLLSRLVSSLSIKLDENVVNIIWKGFLELTSNESTWASTSPDTIISQSIATTASNLLQVLNLFASNIQWSGTNDAAAILKLLPRPKTDTNGEVNRQSVCQPAEKPSKNSAASFVSSTPVFYANILKLLIQFLDSTSAHHLHIIKARGIEHLVCLIANSSTQNVTITRNAASALARLIKAGDSRTKERCRDLRGIEMLVELGKAGKI